MLDRWDAKKEEAIESFQFKSEKDKIVSEIENTRQKYLNKRLKSGHEKIKEKLEWITKDYEEQKNILYRALEELSKYDRKKEYVKKK